MAWIEMWGEGKRGGRDGAREDLAPRS